MEKFHILKIENVRYNKEVVMIKNTKPETRDIQGPQNRNFIPKLNGENANLLGKNFFQICEEFNISPNHQVILLGQKHLRTINNWKRDKIVGESWDVFNRVSLLLGIVKNLSIIYPRNPEVAKEWMHKKRKIFYGKSALDLIFDDPIQSQAALFTIRRVLDMYRNGVIFELS